MAIQSVNPATGEVVEVFEPTSPALIERAVSGAHAAFLEWRRVPIAERAVPMREAARLLRARKTDYARTMALEMGKPIAQGEAEVEKCALACDYYAGRSRFHARRAAARDGCLPELRALRSPRGRAGHHAVELSLLAGVPLRGPGASWRAMAACSSMPRTCRDARSQIEEVFQQAGFPHDLFRTVLVGSSRRRGSHRRPAYRRRDPHRERPRGLQGGGGGRPGAEEDRARAGRQRPLHRPRRCRSGRRRPRRRRRSAGQWRAELHRRQALHRGGVGGRPFPRPLPPGARVTAHGRSALA